MTSEIVVFGRIHFVLGDNSAHTASMWAYHESDMIRFMKPNTNEEFWYQIKWRKFVKHCPPTHQRKIIFPRVHYNWTRPVQLYRSIFGIERKLKNIAIYRYWIEMDIVGWKTGILILVLILQILIYIMKLKWLLQNPFWNIEMEMNIAEIFCKIEIENNIAKTIFSNWNWYQYCKLNF